jgi:hypothetical protein
VNLNLKHNRRDAILERLKRNTRDALDDVGRSRAGIDYARKEIEKDVRFNALLGDKDNHNIHGCFNQLAGLGSTKLR